MHFWRRAERNAAGCAAVIVASLIVACGGGGDEGTQTPSLTGTTVSTTATSVPLTATAAASVTPTTAVAAPTSTASAPPGDSTPVPPPPGKTTAPPPPPPPTSTPVPPPTGNVSLTIAAVMTKFSPSSATVPAGATVTLTFDNQDAGVMHDFVLYAPGGSSVVASTDIGTGPIQQTITFTVATGQYAFKCSVHPREMNGAITAQ